MIGLSLSFDLARAGSPIEIVLSADFVDAGAPPSTIVGNLTVPLSDLNWTYSLLNDADGRFAISGSNLVVGSTPITRGGPPLSITIEATAGTETLRKTIPISVSKPLPALPLPSGAKVAFLGDSYVQRGGYSRMQPVSGNLVPAGGAIYARGLWGQLASLDQRYKIEMFDGDPRPYIAESASDSLMNGAIHGLGGDRVNGISADRPGFLGRLDACLSVDPAIIVVETPGGNNVSDGTGVNAIISHLDTLAKRIRIAGVPAVFVTMPFFVSKSYRHDIIEAVNNWLRAQVAAGRSGFYLADADALEGQGKIPQDIGWLTDGVHRGPQAACRVAREVLQPVLSTLVSAGSFFDKSPLSNNLLPAKGLPGTAGTKSVSAGAVSDITGSVATRMEVRRTAGTSRIACSKEVIETGDEYQVVTITPVNDGAAYHSLTLRDNNNNGAAADLALSALGVDVNNDWGLEWIWQVELDGWDGWKVLPSSASPAGFSVLAYDNVAFTNTANSASFGAGVFVMRHLMRFRQAQGRIPTNLRIAKFGTPWTLTWRSDVSGTGVAKMRSPVIRRLTSNPMVDWNL